ncbi:unnamed protein product [Amoebophrya sp. A25]|nr:unnamed protein product [Amoebophrya sp. A25]|eukprot:GSA25T00002127001.1
MGADAGSLHSPIYADTLGLVLDSLRACLAASKQPAYASDFLTELVEPLISLYDVLPQLTSTRLNVAAQNERVTSCARLVRLLETIGASNDDKKAIALQTANKTTLRDVAPLNVELVLQRLFVALVHQLAEEEDRKQLVLSLLHKTQKAVGGEVARLALVRTLKALWRNEGCAIVSSLSDTMLFAVELLEDESEQVERETKELLKIVQNVTGEDVQELLREKR